MLVATPGQTTSYPLHNSGVPKSKTSTTTCHVSSSATPKTNSNNNNLNNAVHKSAAVLTTTTTRHIVNNKLSSSDASSTTANNTNNSATTNTAASNSTTTTTALMKTLSVRLNRGTEFLKGTVQKALISATAAAAATSTTVTSNSTANANTTTTGAAASTSTTTTSSSASTSTSRLIVPSSSFLKQYTVPPTITHRYPEERVQIGSADSLTKEMCHFKPIRSEPTTPWKCGTKSRGGAASLKHPKACLATKYNIDCDDPIIKDDGRQYSVGEAPKANSTLLTTIISTPSHQSAFVCLFAQMKNLVNIQAKQQLLSLSPSSASNKTLKLLHKTTTTTTTTKKIRGGAVRRKRNSKMSKSPLNVPLTQLLLRQRKASFVQVKKLQMPTELIINSKSARKPRTKIYTAKTTPLHILPTSAGSKAKLKENAKTKQFINIVALAHENNQSAVALSAGGGGADADIGGGDGMGGRGQRKLRKRRISCDLTAEINERMLRKSARLSKDCSSEVMKITAVKNSSGGGNTKKRQARLIAERDHNSFSPPLTRSRLKQLMLQKKFNSATTAAVTTLDHRQQQQVA